MRIMNNGQRGKKLVMKYLFFIFILISLRCDYPEEYFYNTNDTKSEIYGIEVFLEKESIAVGEITSAHVRIIMKNGEKEDAESNSIEWVSGNSDVATVDESGAVTGLKKGFATITAYYERYSSSAQIEVMEYIDCSRIVISEVFYDAVGSDTGLEYIEIQNRNEEICDLSGFSIHDGYSGSSVFVLPEGTLISPGEYLLVVQDPGEFTQCFGVEPGISGLNFQLNNSGETLTLADPELAVIDRIYIEGGYSSDPAPESWGDLSLPSASEGESVQRTGLKNTGTSLDWFSGSPTPGF